MRLNRWVRTGILLSIVWAIGSAMHTHSADEKSAQSWMKIEYDTCITSQQLKHDPDLSSCDAKRLEAHKTWMQGGTGSMIFVALAPLPLAWFIVFIAVYLVRAFAIGFPAIVPWRTLSRARKGFVVFCCVGSFLIVLVCITAFLNLYVDTKVPVGMSSFKDFVTRDGYVMVSGTWTRTDLTDDTIANPLQTSKIQCDKAANKCTEALASVTGNTLMTDLTEYDIQSWTPDAVVMRDEALCATTTYTIDLNTKAVTGAGHSTHENDAFCAMNHGEEKSWTLQLNDGFKVYWELRQKARPMPLRVIQSLFGN